MESKWGTRVQFVPSLSRRIYGAGRPSSPVKRLVIPIVDVVYVYSDRGDDPPTELLKLRFKKEGNETVTFCNRLKMQAGNGILREKSGYNLYPPSVEEFTARDAPPPQLYG